MMRKLALPARARRMTMTKNAPEPLMTMTIIRQDSIPNKKK